MEKFYPIGTVVKLKKGESGIMITGVLPLYNYCGKLGYFDYTATLYPQGQTDKNSLFFNEEDIEEVIHKGFEDDIFFPKYKEVMLMQMQKITYPHFKLDMIKQ